MAFDAVLGRCWWDECAEGEVGGEVGGGGGGISTEVAVFPCIVCLDPGSTGLLQLAGFLLQR